MARPASLILICLAVWTAQAAETVTAFSAPFSFPSATGTVRQAPAPASAALTCRALEGSLSVHWITGDAAVTGSIRLTRLDGRLVASSSLKGAEGNTVLTRVPAGVYLVMMTAGNAARTVRAALSR